MQRSAAAQLASAGLGCKPSSGTHLFTLRVHSTNEMTPPPLAGPERANRAGVVPQMLFRSTVLIANSLPL